MGKRGKSAGVPGHDAKRRMTIYFPGDVAKALAHRCVDLDRDASDVVTEAVQLWLARGAK